jgi:hypothetical protein
MQKKYWWGVGGVILGATVLGGFVKGLLGKVGA